MSREAASRTTQPLVRAISLWQPYASLLFAAPAFRKRFETRPWRTNHRGPLLIHASVAWSKDVAAMCETEPFWSAIRSLPGYDPRVSISEFLPRGGYIGRLDVTGCFSTNEMDPPTDFEDAFGDWSPDRWVWETENAIPFPLVPRRGQQRLWTPDAAELARICQDAGFDVVRSTR